MNLADLAIDPRAASDLVFLWEQSDGMLGLKSSHMAMVARLQVGGRTGGAPICEVDTRCLEAAERARKVRRALERLTVADRNALTAAHHPQMTERVELEREARTDGKVALALHAFEKAFGSVCWLALKTDAAAAAHEMSESSRTIGSWLVRLAARVAGKKATAADRAAIQAVRREAETRYAKALRAYSSARRSIAR